MEEELGSPESSGTFIIPILERLDEASQRQVDNDVRLQKTLESLLKFLDGYGGDRQGGRSGGQPPEKNPLQNKNPSSLMNAFSWMGEKKDKAVEFIKKGFFKLFKTDYFGNLFKAINNLAKALTNSFMSWLKFFLMMAFIDPSGGFLRDIINLFTEIGMMLFKIIMPLIPVAVKMMFDTIVYVFKLVLRLIPDIISTIMQTFTQLGNTFPILKPFIGFINQFLSAIRSLFVVFNDPKADKGNSIKKFLKKVFEILLDMVGKAVEFIAPYVPKVISAISDFIMQTLIPALIKYVPKLLDVFSEGISMIITKYPNLKVWLQPLKDIFDMISAYIGSFAKFDSGAFVKENDEYKKLEKATMQSKEYTRATEEARLKMLSDLQYGFMVDNKQMVKDAEAQFIKQTDDKLNLAKTKWDEFITHVMESLGKAYNNLPDTAKYALWIYGFVKVVGILATIIGFFSKLWTVLAYLAPIGTFLLGVFKAIGIAIATFVGGLSAVTIGIVIAIAVIIGLIWYFWDDIKKFFSEGWDSLVKWWDTVDIMGPLKNTGLAILGFLGDLIDGFYDEFIKPIGDMFSDIFDFVGSIKLPDWMTSWMNGMGGGTDASELQNSRKPQNASLDANTFDEIAKQRHEAEKNYLKSNQFLTDEKLKKRYELKAIDSNNLFSDYGKNFTTKIEDEVKKNPIKADIKIDTSTLISKPDPIKLDMTSAIKSATNFDMYVSNIFTQLGRWVRLIFKGTLGMTKVSKLEETIDFAKLGREDMYNLTPVTEFIANNQTISDLYEKAIANPQGDIKSFQNLLKDTEEYKQSKNQDELLAAFTTAITRMSTKNASPTVIWTAFAQALAKGRQAGNK